MLELSRNLPACTPQRVGRFRLLEMLGERSIGPLYTAHDPEHDQVVWLEVWSATGVCARRRRRVHDEAQALARVCHPNVVRILEVGIDERHVFIAKERVGGEDLQQVLRRRRLPVNERVELFAAVARGLQALHDAGLTSLGFAPHKVLVMPDTQPVLTEFGFVPQTARYMSPEQIARHPLAPASDQFSFGVALYEALCCRHPFVHTDVASLHAAVLEGRSVPADARELSKQIQATVMRCLRANPQARFESMAEVARALEIEDRSAKPLVALAVFAAFGLAVAACAQLA